MDLVPVSHAQIPNAPLDVSVPNPRVVTVSGRPEQRSHSLSLYSKVGHGDSPHLFLSATGSSDRDLSLLEDMREFNLWVDGRLSLLISTPHCHRMLSTATARRRSSTTIPSPWTSSTDEICSWLPSHHFALSRLWPCTGDSDSGTCLCLCHGMSRLLIPSQPR